jgi:hypothetical protein
LVTPREDLQYQLRQAKAAGKPQDLEAAIEAVVGRLGSLGQEMADAEPARRREVFRLFVSRIDLRFSKIQRGKRMSAPLNLGRFSSVPRSPASSVL